MPDYINDFNVQELELIAGTSVDYSFDVETDDVKVTITDENNNIVIGPNGQFASYFVYNSSNYTQNEYDPYVDGFTGLKIDDDDSEPTTPPNILLFPSQTLSQKLFPSGVYDLNYHFLKNFFTIAGIGNNPKFIIDTISPSRKEVRLIAKNDTFEEDGSPVLTILNNVDFNAVFYGTAADSYNPFNFVLGFSQGRYIPVVNYTVDTVTFDYDSLILRLNEPLPLDLTMFDEVTLDRKVITSQNINVNYISNIIGSDSQGSLTPDTSFYSNTNQTLDSLQNYNNLISGSDNIALDEILTEISQSDVNLNIDFTNFSNHVVFGSATEKLKNFKTKVSNIENHLLTLSQSLYSSGSSMIQTRKDTFEEIRKIKQTFTPYEKFLYNDNQFTFPYTASAPGVGQNYASQYPVSGGAQMSILKNHDGFGQVFKHTTQGLGSSQKIHIFNDQFRVDKAPLYNYSGSVYLSFILRGNHEITGSTSGLTFETTNADQFPILPNSAHGSSSILSPDFSINNYRRFIYQASQSYWRPTTPGVVTESDVADIYQLNFTGSIHEGQVTIDIEDDNNYTAICQILNGSNITGSHEIVAHNYQTYGQLISSNPNQGIKSGSILPMGDLFPISWYGDKTAVLSSFITDVKLTLNDPSKALPFSLLYSTSSTEFSNWYDGLLLSASSYDDNNIHSLQNNLPVKLKEKSDSTTLKKFVNMLGESYDLSRNYIDNYKSFAKRKYDKNDTMPNNLLPILAKNLGWELIDPFDSNLSSFYNTIASGSEDVIKNVKNNVWRNNLNNLIYILKTKGTQESIKALLNCYGYPPDVIRVKEYGGSLEEQNPSTITNDGNALTKGLLGTNDNVSFIQTTEQFGSLKIYKNSKLNFDWWTNNANGVGLEFVLSSPSNTTEQIIVESSGSGNEKLWDLAIVPSASNSNTASLRFRLNNSKTGSLAIASNAVSMSTSYFSLNNSKLWNVMLQKRTSSLNSAITQSYDLYLGLQEFDKISKFEKVTLTSHDQITNVNFMSGSSLDITSSTPVSGNLILGRTFTGSLAEFRAWNEILSASKFKQHILNKKSVVGNTISSSREGLIYRYRLNENYKRNEAISLVDANKNYNNDYTKTVNLINCGSLYQNSTIDVFKFSQRSDGYEQQNDNKVLIRPTETFTLNLNYKKPSSIPSNSELNRSEKRKNSSKIVIERSPVDKIDAYILNQISDFNIADKFADPQNQFESEYTDLDTFRNEVLTGVKLDINKYISSQEKLFNYNILDNLQNIIPGRTTIEQKGIVIKQDILKRNKVKLHPLTIESSSAFEGDSIIMTNYFNLSSSNFTTPFTSSINYFYNLNNSITGSYNDNFFENATFLDYVSDYTNITSSVIPIHTGSINQISNYYVMSSSFSAPYSSSINYLNFYNATGSFTSIFEKQIKYINNYLNVSNSKYFPMYESSVDLINSYYNMTSSNFISTHENSNLKYIDDILIFTGSFETPYVNSNFSYIDDNLILTSSVIFEHSSSINYINNTLTFSGSLNENVFEKTFNYIDDTLIITSSINDNLYEKTFNYIDNYLNISSSANNNLYEKTLNYSDYYTITSTHNENLHESSVKHMTERFLPDKQWYQGEFDNNVHFPHFANAGADGDYNTNYVEKGVEFITIGDTELQSGSFKHSEIFDNWSVELSEMGTTLNKIFIDQDDTVHPVTYNSYWNVRGSSDLENPVPGRMIGRTSYFTSSNGVLYYPSNHYINAPTTKQRLNKLFYQGTQNLGGKIMFPHGLDILTASAYTIDIGGSDTDKILKVEKKL